MNKLFQKIILITLIFPTNLIAITQTSIVGHYRCTGDDFLNHTRFDEPTVLEKKGDIYYFTWLNKNNLFKGQAILHENVLSALFWNSANELDMGVVTYRILPNGDLKGKWTHKNSQQVGDEYCVKINGIK